jgi:hypothetical protein
MLHVNLNFYQIVSSITSGINGDFLDSGQTEKLKSLPKYFYDSKGDKSFFRSSGVVA